MSATRSGVGANVDARAGERVSVSLKLGSPRSGINRTGQKILEVRWGPRWNLDKNLLGFFGAMYAKRMRRVFRRCYPSIVAPPANGLVPSYWAAALIVGMAMHPGITLAQTQEPSSSSSQAGVTGATPSGEELVKLKQNPVSGLRQVAFQAEVSPDLPETGRTAGAYSLQVVWPFSLNDDWKVISYSILPVLQLPAPSGQSTTVGLGNSVINLFVSPKKAGAIVWGAGPVILLPTRSDPSLGSDQVSLGPSVVIYYAKDAWGAGVVLQNAWSLGGSGINEFNEFAAQYFLNYTLPKNWFLYSNATITADWNLPADNRWIVPLGGGLGRIFNIGKRPVSVSVQAFANVVTPRDGPKWSTIFQFALLFP
jgi:hypothetical protein